MHTLLRKRFGFTSAALKNMTFQEVLATCNKEVLLWSPPIFDKGTCETSYLWYAAIGRLEFFQPVYPHVVFGAPFRSILFASLVNHPPPFGVDSLPKGEELLWQSFAGNVTLQFPS